MHQQRMLPAAASGRVTTAACHWPVFESSRNARNSRCVARASTSELAAPPQQQAQSGRNQFVMAAVEALFRFPPFFNAAASKARAMIVQRGEAIGLDWNGELEALKAQDWEAPLAAVTNPALVYPDYYTQPFHAYPQGNLCWDAALEVSLAAASVHAPVMDPTGKTLDPKGDEALRSSYGRCMLQQMTAAGVDPASVKAVVDLGCATGLSTLALQRLFPGASLTGVDLSPHFLAVGRHLQQQREAAAGAPEPITFVHGLAEDTQLPAGSANLVSMCLVAHELPQRATQAILKEAYRLLRPGGVMSIMEMNPASPAFQRIFANPFAYTAFKSTEPWLEEYVSLDLAGALQEAGFSGVSQQENSPRHRTVVAVKAA